jgi:hypothetical protein
VVVRPASIEVPITAKALVCGGVCVWNVWHVLRNAHLFVCECS